MKKTLSLILAVMMLLGCMSITAFAAPSETDLAALKENMNTNSGTIIQFGTYAGGKKEGQPIEWYVVGDQEKGVKAPDGCVTIITKDFLTAKVKFNNEKTDGNAYDGSVLKNAIDTAAVFTATEKSTIKSRTLAVDSYKAEAPYCNGVAGNAVEAEIWAPTTADGAALGIVYSDYGIWYCSPGESDTKAAYSNDVWSMRCDVKGSYVTLSNTYGVALCYLDLSRVKGLKAVEGKEKTFTLDIAAPGVPSQITAEITAADFGYTMVIPTATTLTEANHENVLLGTDGKVSITNIKHPTDKVNVSYTVDLSNGNLTDGTMTINATYKYKQGDAEFAAIDDTTKVTVYANKTVNDSFVNVTANKDQWNAAPAGTYNATVVFNFAQEKIFATVREVLTAAPAGSFDDAYWYDDQNTTESAVINNIKTALLNSNHGWDIELDTAVTKQEDGSYKGIASEDDVTMQYWSFKMVDNGLSAIEFHLVDKEEVTDECKFHLTYHETTNW